MAASSLPTEMTDYRSWRHRRLTGARSARRVGCEAGARGEAGSAGGASAIHGGRSPFVCHLTAVKWHTRLWQPEIGAAEVR